MSLESEEVQIQKKVLVVEDERIIAINICTTLKQFGYFTEYVSDGASALKKIESDAYDLVLMDIMLGGDIDGIEVARIVKKKKEIPVIYLTAYSDESTLDRAKTTEPFGYLIKPFNSRDLYVSVEMAIYKSHIQKQLKEIQQKLSEAQKWETIGLVAAGISHEINNPLTSIMNYSELISKDANHNGNKQILGYSSKIYEDSERIAKIIKNLVNYSQATTNQSSLVSVAMLVNDTRSFLHQYFLKEGIQCIIEAEEVSPVFCQPQKLKQAILNLLQDARARVLHRGENQPRKIIAHIGYDTEGSEKRIKFSITDTGVENISQKLVNSETIEITNSIIMELGGKMTRIDEKEGGRWEIFLPIETMREQRN